MLLRARALEPRNPLFPTRMAEAALAAQENDKAVGYLREALQLDPAFEPALSKLGQYHLERGEIEPADAVFADYVEYVPDSSTAHMLRGVTQRALGLTDEALRHFETAIDLDPTNFAAVAQSAGTLLDLGRTNEAKAQLEAAAALNPEAADVHGALADIALSEGKFEAALASYRRAAQYDPQNETYLYSASNALFALERLPEAIEHLKQVLEIAPNRVDAWFAIGNYHKILGETEAARAAYQTFLDLAPAHFADARTIAEESIAELTSPVPAQASVAP